jgi:hypothetical protein
LSRWFKGTGLRSWLARFHSTRRAESGAPRLP